MSEKKTAVVDRVKLPSQFPTHHHSGQFWEQLGRTIATFGFLEEVLGKAIFAFTATRPYESTEALQVAYKAWLIQLQKALTDPLVNLAEVYGKVVRANSESTIENVDDLVKAIKTSAEVRNVLCHGSWDVPDKNGKSLPFFINKKNEKFETYIDKAYLEQVQKNVTDLICDVIDSVTHMGWEFPGGAGIGEKIWP